MKSNKKIGKRIYQILIVIGVLIIPLAYSLFYLGAFWDPYSRLDKLPIAVVNNDAGSVIDGKARNLGDEMVSRMRSDNSLKWVFTDQKDGQAGVDSTKYYAIVVIPKDFSASVASAEGSDKKTALVTYESNQGRNFLASQIFTKAVLMLEEEARSDVNRELTQNLSGKLGDVPGKLQDLNNGLASMCTGAGSLADGAAKLSSGQGDLVSGAKTLDSGLADLASGARSLSSNMGSLNSGLMQAATGAKTLSDGAAALPALANGISNLDSCAASLAKGESDYVSGVDSLIGANRQIASTLADYAARNPAAAADPELGAVLQQLSSGGAKLDALQQSGSALKAGADGLKSGADALKKGSAGLSSLSSGAAQLRGSMDKLQSGASQLYSGTQSLLSGAKDAKTGSASLLSGATDLQKSASDLKGGATNLQDAIGTARQKVGDSISDANSELKKTNGLGDFAAAPVKLKDTTVNPVPNYGTAFAPYFMSLSFWVGAIILFVGIYLDPNNRLPLLSRFSDRKFLRLAAFVLITLVQACSLALLVVNVLHLHVSSLPMFFLTCILVAMVFMSIVQFLVINLGDIGKFLAILLLILQLTACGGTFPMELLPNFFNAIYRFMPMTYSVNLLKDAISGVSGGNVAQAVWVLVSVFAVFTAANVIFSVARRGRAAKASVAPNPAV